MTGFGNSGSAARFFYCAKASKADRGEGNSHPTVKPTKLMEYLINLVLPNGGILVDPFCGSGTTGVAASRLGVHAILIDQDEKSCEIAAKRCSREIDNGETAENSFLNDDKIEVITKNCSQTETSIFDI
jgi:site-specific DNA-methyltransferase (adenine-specific)